ncbi:hypothetical protein LTR36_001040 [Oleoguttula mirabilis]|uniref:Uncharacterized protein n=1 Tax=Oleoguttula mirabilis TaxID=1507867 RepID=A0AAV9JPN9_9PEZI|nr:hypothetical protein LTR36_001040 [Oleoguttula mirabilis]
MDPIEQLCHKINTERTYQSLRQQPTPPETAPPPYTPSDDDSDSDDDDEPDTSSPLKLTINAAHSIQGSNNLVPTSPTPLADATKFSTILLAAVKQLNSVADNAGDGKSRRAVKIDLTINCGITVIGDRNVIGNVGLKPKSSAQAMAGPGDIMGGQAANAVTGAKRKAEADFVEEPEAKRTAVGGAEN